MADYFYPISEILLKYADYWGIIDVVQALSNEENQ